MLVTIGNLYGYGPVDGPMTEDTPLAATGAKGRVRNRMWADALAAHRAGRVRVTEVRGSDYVGAGRHLAADDWCCPGCSRGQRVVLPVDCGRPAQLDVHRRRRPYPGRRRHRRAGLGPGLARAQRARRADAGAGRPGGGPGRRARAAS